MSINIRNLKLNPGEELCPKCNGRKVIEGFRDNKVKLMGCPYCLGEGKMLWIDVIKGGKNIPENSFNTYNCWNSVMSYREDYIKYITIKGDKDDTD